MAILLKKMTIFVIKKKVKFLAFFDIQMAIYGGSDVDKPVGRENVRLLLQQGTEN